MVQRAVLIAALFLPFCLLGAGWGVVFDIVTAAEKPIRLRAVTFVLDALMMLSFGCSFVLLLIARCEGVMRMAPLLFCIVGLTAYLCTIHKTIKRMFDKLLIFSHKLVKNKKKE